MISVTHATIVAMEMLLLCIVVFAVELLLPEEAAGLCVEQGVADAASEAVGVPGPGGHLEDVPVRYHVAAEAALARFRLWERSKTLDHRSKLFVQISWLASRSLRSFAAQNVCSRRKKMGL